jgi:hypothetical protein
LVDRAVLSHLPGPEAAPVRAVQRGARTAGNLFRA